MIPNTTRAIKRQAFSFAGMDDDDSNEDEEKKPKEISADKRRKSIKKELTQSLAPAEAKK